jgi:ribosomal protein S18
MAKDDSKEIERLKALIRERIKRVPPKVTGGGIDATRRFKKAVEKANQLLASNKTTLLQAQTVFGSLNTYYL